MLLKSSLPEKISQMSTFYNGIDENVNFFAIRVQGFGGSEVWGFRGSKVQGFGGSEVQGSKVKRYRGASSCL